MSKLFALEELETGTTEVELEAAPEVGEVADVQAEAMPDIAEVESQSEGINEGIEAADQLEQVEAVVSDAVENGEGLDPVAAESLRIAVEAICARVGANPKAMYALYATENFSSASSRKANSKIALESVSEFLKSLWEKIKAAVKNLWEKVQALWNKHLSSLGRTVKALESMKDKVSQAKGTGTYDPVEVPESLRSIFPSKAATLGIDEMSEFATTINRSLDSISKFRMLEDASKATKLADLNNVAEQAKGSGIVVEFGSEDKPLPGGSYFKWTYKLESEDDDGVKILTLDVEEDHGKFTDGRKNNQLDIANKEALKSLINEYIKSAKDLVKYRDKVEQRAKNVANAFKAIDKELNEAFKTDKSGMKNAKSAVRCFQLVMSKGPAMETKLLGAQLMALKGVLVYTSVCLKNYK